MCLCVVGYFVYLVLLAECNHTSILPPAQITIHAQIPSGDHSSEWWVMYQVADENTLKSVHIGSLHITIQLLVSILTSAIMHVINYTGHHGAELRWKIRLYLTISGTRQHLPQDLWATGSLTRQRGGHVVHIALFLTTSLPLQVPTPPTAWGNSLSTTLAWKPVKVSYDLIHLKSAGFIVGQNTVPELLLSKWLCHRYFICCKLLRGNWRTAS